MTAEPAPPLRRRDVIVAVSCGLCVAAMVGASYAAVPFYNWFCRTTGYGGTTQVATSAPGEVLDRKITVRFDANVGPGLPWRFEPEQNSIEVKVGEVVTVHYRVINEAARPTTATAAYNVTPLNIGAYFQKINCFCFTEQRLKAAETRCPTPSISSASRRSRWPTARRRAGRQDRSSA
jgi:cytochrome c oxidase assembly protein subunit 11